MDPVTTELPRTPGTSGATGDDGTAALRTGLDMTSPSKGGGCEARGEVVSGAP